MLQRATESLPYCIGFTCGGALVGIFPFELALVIHSALSPMGHWLGFFPFGLMRYWFGIFHFCGWGTVTPRDWFHNRTRVWQQQGIFPYCIGFACGEALVGIFFLFGGLGNCDPKAPQRGGKNIYIYIYIDISIYLSIYLSIYIYIYILNWLELVGMLNYMESIVKWAINLLRLYGTNKCY